MDEGQDAGRSGRRPRVTIKDVARRAGVSPSTVSHAFSSRRVISEATKDRVFVAARDLSYIADPHARSMRTGKTGMIGLVLRPRVDGAEDSVSNDTFNRLPVVATLRAGGYDVREVQACRTNDRRRRRHRAKTDITDAQAIAAETLADPGLPPARKHNETPSPAWDTLHVLRSQRQSLVLQRVRLLNEAEPVLCALPVEIRDQLPATSRVLVALRALRALDLKDLSRADDARVQWLRSSPTAVETITLDLKHIDGQVPALLAELGCTLTEVVGIGVVTAMTLLIEIGDPTRFRTEAQFARWCGAAPVAISSGEGHGQPRGHRIDLAGNRQVNSVLHIVHVTQARMHEPAKSFLAKRAPTGKTTRGARRAHKRQLANVIIRRMWRDADQRRTPVRTTAA